MSGLPRRGRLLLFMARRALRAGVRLRVVASIVELKTQVSEFPVEIFVDDVEFRITGFEVVEPAGDVEGRIDGTLTMGRNDIKTGKRSRPKTATKGTRYRCAKCHKRSPKPLKTPAPWFCPNCLQEREASTT